MSTRTSQKNLAIIKRVDANMKVEGFNASRSVKRDCIAMPKGKISADELVNRYVVKHTRKLT